MIAPTISPQVAEYLGHVEGGTFEEKLLALLESYVSSQLRDCEREIGNYEVKYRSTFAEFANAWAGNAVPEKHSHQVERDYMEWEGLEAEKKRWLNLLKLMPRNSQAEK
jgi:hypothetical protein